MKNQFIITVVFIAFTSFASQLFAQAPAAKSADWDLAKGKGGVSCSVAGTDEGCLFTFQKIEMSTREAGSGMATGKRQHKPYINTFAVSSIDNSVTEVKSPRDVATGQSTGKRLHGEVVVTKEYDKSSPMLAKKVSSSDEITVLDSGLGKGKASLQDIHFSMKGNGKPITLSCPSGDCIIPTDLPDGEYTLSCDWSWGVSQSGGSSTHSSGGKVSSKRCSVDFLLQIENGGCMAINEKGLQGGSTKSKK